MDVATDGGRAMTEQGLSPTTSAAAPTPPVIVMGVSGSGKSTIGSSLAAALGSPFIDGDDLHPSTNKAKMSRGVPLTDEDRAPWLADIAERISTELEQGRSLVVACSALKRRYRALLIERAPSTVLVHLTGDPELIAERLAGRSHEFMSKALLSSQLEALEPLDADERGIDVDLARTPDEMVADAVQGIRVLHRLGLTGSTTLTEVPRATSRAGTRGVQR